MVKRPQLRPHPGENVQAIVPAYLARKGHCVYCGRRAGSSLACREHRDLLSCDPIVTLARDTRTPA